MRRWKNEAFVRRHAISREFELNKPVLNEDDSLFGVLREEQVGMCSVTGRPKIVKEVFDEMRQYLMLATEEDRVVREERVRSSVGVVEQDLILQRTVLRLEAPPVVSKDPNKGKGIVFSYEDSKKVRVGSAQSEKLMASAIRAGTAGRWNAGNVVMTESEEANVACIFRVSSDGSTVFSTGF